MSRAEVERVARRLWERIGFLALSQPVVYEREIDLMKTAQRAQGRDTDFLDAKRKTLAQIAESEARDALAMLEHALLDQRQAGKIDEREAWLTVTCESCREDYSDYTAPEQSEVSCKKCGETIPTSLSTPDGWGRACSADLDEVGICEQSEGGNP